MSIKIEVDIKRSKVIRTPADEAFRRIRTVEEQTYGWALHKIGNAKHNTIRYARYRQLNST